MNTTDDLLLGGAAMYVMSSVQEHQNQEFYNEHGYLPWRRRHPFVSLMRNAVVALAVTALISLPWFYFVVQPIVKGFHLYNPQTQLASNCGWSMFLFSIPFIIAFVLWLAHTYRHNERRWHGQRQHILSRRLSRRVVGHPERHSDLFNALSRQLALLTITFVLMVVVVVIIDHTT
jgi:hypothetical protein